MKANFFKAGALFVASLVVLNTSCSKEEENTLENAKTSHLPQNVLKKALELELDPETIGYEDVELPNGTIVGLVNTLGDTSIEVDEFLNIPVIEGEARQYRSANLVDTDTYDVIDIYVYNGGQFGVSPIVQQGVLDAVENWNNTTDLTFLRPDIEFRVTFGDDETINTNDGVYEILIVKRNVAPFLAQSMFPGTNNKPGFLIRVNTAFNDNTNVGSDFMEHVMTHEIGHAIGFRHTDWNSRQSCVDVGFQEETSIETGEVNLIFGTLPSIPGILVQEDSLMNACLDNSTDGELSSRDKDALFFLYPPY